MSHTPQRKWILLLLPPCLREYMGVEIGGRQAYGRRWLGRHADAKGKHQCLLRIELSLATGRLKGMCKKDIDQECLGREAAVKSVWKVVNGSAFQPSLGPSSFSCYR